MLSKRNTRKQAKRHGFRARKKAGGKVLKSRRQKGRKRLTR